MPLGKVTMARWIELHRDDREHTPVVVNVDWIMWFEPEKGYTKLALGYGPISGNNGNVCTSFYFVRAVETYAEIKDKLNIL